MKKMRKNYEGFLRNSKNFSSKQEKLLELPSCLFTVKELRFLVNPIDMSVRSIKIINSICDRISKKLGVKFG